MQLAEEKLHQLEFILSSGKGNITVNDKQLDVYFGRKVAQMLGNAAFRDDRTCRES